MDRREYFLYTKEYFGMDRVVFSWRYVIAWRLVCTRVCKKRKLMKI
jgi:hypothetical protein